jgi:glutamate-1-semialdehyde 2,1-aminomutase
MSILNENYQQNKYLFTKGIGSYVFSKSKKYLDLTSGGGCLLLGHNNKIFKKTIKEFTKKNISNFAAPNEFAKKLSLNLIKIFPQFKKIIFCNSGAEANLKALRICRALTKKDMVINVAGSWHGSVDQFLFTSNRKNIPVPISEGLEKNNKRNLIYIPYNDINRSIKILDKYKNEISCVFLEPIQACLPDKDSENYLKFISDYCKKNKIILVLDEIITGLRIDGTSIQNKLDLYSDISTFGKAFGNGLPISFIGISKNIYKKIIANKINIFFGGTFSGNSLSTHMSNETLKFILKNKNIIFSKLKSYSLTFKNKINEFVKLNNIKVKVYAYDSIIRIIFSNKKIENRVQRDFLEKKNINEVNNFYKYLFKKKIIYPKNGIIFLSYSIKSYELNYLISNIKYGLKKFFSK